jgi:hypothetical protein
MKFLVAISLVGWASMFAIFSQGRPKTDIFYDAHMFINFCASGVFVCGPLYALSVGTGLIEGSGSREMVEGDL